MQLPPPGGDVIGRRRVDTHFLALPQAGREVVEDPDFFGLRARGAQGAGHVPGRAQRHRHRERRWPPAWPGAPRASATPPPSRTSRTSATCWSGWGAKIDGHRHGDAGDRGQERLRGGRFRITSDHIEVGSFIGLAAVTRGEITIEDAAPEHLDSTLIGFARLGVKIEVRGNDLFIPGGQDPHVQMDMGGHIPKVDDGPWPAFPADLTSIALVTATQCTGTVLVHEKMFESRMFFADKLIGMGARLVLCDPHRVLVMGPSQLRGAEVESPDIRAGMGLLIAALGARGRSEIYNIGQIERGYERIDERLRALGADIEKSDSRS
jgi:UDP-N-acetylglucosamine 1-carboxyvinyltransferase